MAYKVITPQSNDEVGEIGLFGVGSFIKNPYFLF